MYPFDEIVRSERDKYFYDLLENIFASIGYETREITGEADIVETETDNFIGCDPDAAITVTMLPATGSNRVRTISNVSIYTVTVDGDGTDTIDGELTQELYEYDSMSIKDYAVGKWKII